MFYTNLESKKGDELQSHPQAALCFHWKSLQRQVRVRGPVSAVDDAEADAYYASRSRESRLGAWASQQSRTLADRANSMRPMPIWRRALRVEMTLPARRTGLDGDNAAQYRVLAGWQPPAARPAGLCAARARCSVADTAPLSLGFNSRPVAIGFGADKGEACLFQHARGGHGCSVAIDRADNLHANWQTG